MGKRNPRLDPEQAYAALADELNDGTPGQLSIDDFDPRYVAAGRRYAETHGLSWPPQTGSTQRRNRFRTCCSPSSKTDG